METDMEPIMHYITWSKMRTYYYIPAALFFCLSVMGLGKHETAQKGNIIGILGALLAVGATLAENPPAGDGLWLFFLSVVPPSIVGIVLAAMVPMTSMPETVGLLNAFGGLAAALTAIGTSLEDIEYGLYWVPLYVNMAVIYLSVFVGCVTFSGSIVACLKLRGTIRKKIDYRIMHHITILTLFSVCVCMGLFLYYEDDSLLSPCVLGGSVVLSLFLGVHVVGAIGGADMPVIISLLNSCSGWAGVMAGFACDSTLLVTAGAVVGSSGAILSYIMCQAMNRSNYIQLYKK
eukprot:GHVR01018907.1.p1 GENE.GHVR01018907.1~~GHVR01018907.1.p1  ORF type:complete len:290 (+),score=52.32 GHVR01018907.1:42-911(+)